MKETGHYFRGIDSLKGILVVLVFVGHFLPGLVTDNLVRYAIYSFHMPLFLGISGFLSLIFSFLWLSIYSDSTVLGQSPVFYWLGDKRLYEYFVFFYFGYYLRNSAFAKNIPFVLIMSIVIAFFCLRLLGFWYVLVPLINALIFIGLNISLIIFCTHYISSVRLRGESFFSFVGVNSLPIYLWHIMPLLVMRQLSIDVRYPYIFYPVGVALFLFLIGIIKFIPRIPITNLIFFGVVSPRLNIPSSND
jgi:peptidoglycan/LPS O-acetylase OafA/YrhL